MKPKIYVAGKYTNGYVIENIREAIYMGDWLFSIGFIPFIPHLTGLWDLITPHHYEVWMEYDAEWLKSCDVLYRMAGESSGADRETKMARELGIPVIYTKEAARKYIAQLGA